MNLKFNSPDLNRISDQHQLLGEGYENEVDNSYATRNIYSSMSVRTQGGTKLPVKTHLADLNQRVGDLQKGLHENSKEIQMLRGDESGLEHFCKDSCDEITQLLMTELGKVHDDLKKVISVDKQESSFLKNQVNTLSQEKMKLQQNALILESRIVDVEAQVGVDL
mmetsp:Transcript_57434/g.65524  ORF Transcript_57434/g.65524 Transcript_57434/m.65524 type:complete len:165 (+) Transcript_57434:193-687(+)|eukprot:CAMPEP_0115019406 /NCGR_PEP_ID=MMETSP0216-20121206/29425_1 /TAXON_ID=223996 /ORGANISM="Protocruzia adherens, Strain Boccale" /LENGTH=164 /DNA_ID=CAMNT_0002390871 /DNA_START=194 /DNA_END=688 /DNA_ORIENTATION=-